MGVWVQVGKGAVDEVIDDGEVVDEAVRHVCQLLFRMHVCHRRRQGFIMIVIVNNLDFIFMIIMIMSSHHVCFIVNSFIGFREGFDFNFDGLRCNSDNATFIIFFNLRTF